MDATLEAVKREGRGKNEANRLRASGRIPAVVYGAKKEGKTPEGVALTVDPKALLRILHSESGANTLISLRVEGTEARVMVKEYQLDPVTHHLLHADFYALAMDKAITVSVPIVIKGEARGVKQDGGIIDFVTRDIEVHCLPTDIPENIPVDVTELNLHDSIRVKDLVQGPKWKAMTDGETMIVHVVMPKAEESAAAATDATAEAAAPAATAEPEVIKKGKEEKEEKREEVKLIVGLGNPGREYRDTRHNAGFMVLDEIVRRHDLAWAMAPAQVPDTFVAKKFGPEPVLLARPQTFMNRSGDAAAALSRYYDVDPVDLLVVVDDIDIPFGRLRTRASGSAGTHNGLRSVVDRLGTQFPRLRVGVGRGDARRDLADHVLAKFEPGEREQLESVITRAADAAEMFAAEGIVKVMNTYNADDAESATE